MKRIFFIVVIISLPIIAFFQYKKYVRFNPPTDYTYPINTEIDLNYYDQDLVDEYFAKSEEAALIARTLWVNQEIDVKFPDSESLEANASAKNYSRIIARLKQIEAVLIQSQQYKADGLSNDQIISIESGVPLELVKIKINKLEMTSLQIGDNSRFVWALQKKLIEKGYPHQLDGLFGADTQNALTRFQSDQGVFPSGAMNEEAFELLFVK